MAKRTVEEASVRWGGGRFARSCLPGCFLGRDPSLPLALEFSLSADGWFRVPLSLCVWGGMH